MKYLKTYETIELQKPDLKKYVICVDSTSTFYYIMEVIENTIYGVKLKALYYTENGTNLIHTENKTYIYTLEDIKKHNIYTADTIEECKDKLPMIITAKKYNIV